MSRRKPTGKGIAYDTALLPYVIAETVVAEAVALTNEAIDNTFETLLVDRAEACYAVNADWRKLITAKRGSKGRDTLYAFMRHWLAGLLKEKQRSTFDKLPAGFSSGLGE